MTPSTGAYKRIQTSILRRFDMGKKKQEVRGRLSCPAIFIRRLIVVR